MDDFPATQPMSCACGDVLTSMGDWAIQYSLLRLDNVTRSQWRDRAHRARCCPEASREVRTDYSCWAVWSRLCFPDSAPSPDCTMLHDRLFCRSEYSFFGRRHPFLNLLMTPPQLVMGSKETERPIRRLSFRDTTRRPLSPGPIL